MGLWGRLILSAQIFNRILNECYHPYVLRKLEFTSLLMLSTLFRMMDYGFAVLLIIFNYYAYVSLYVCLTISIIIYYHLFLFYLLLFGCSSGKCIYLFVWPLIYKTGDIVILRAICQMYYNKPVLYKFDLNSPTAR